MNLRNSLSLLILLVFQSKLRGHNLELFTTFLTDFLHRDVAVEFWKALLASL